MNRYVSLLRGVNVTGYRPVPMARLATLIRNLGYSDVRTYLQSGNVVFGSESDNAARIGGSIETAIEREFGFPVTVIMRRPADLKKIIAGSPFIRRQGVDERYLHVTFLRSRAEPALIKSLVAPDKKSPDEFKIAGSEVYVHCPGGYGRTKISNTFFEKKLNVAATTRNWRTVNALYAIACGLE